MSEGHTVLPPDREVDEPVPPGEGQVELDPLLARAAVCGLFARLLGPDPGPLAGGRERHELRAVLAVLGDDLAATALDELDRRSPLTPEEVAARRTRLFEHGQAPPYEMSYVPSGLAGQTGALADIAGFYRAFGFQVERERPDHCVAELEFFTYLALAEAQYRDDGEHEGAEVCAAATRTFLREHLGGWFDAFAARLEEMDPGGCFGPVVAAAFEYLTAEAARLGVDPARPAQPLHYLGDDGDGDPPECGELPEVAVRLPGFAR